MQGLDIRGKAHNPENAQITAELCRLCQNSDLLRFSPTSSLKVPLRSNQTGIHVAPGSVIRDVVEAILSSTCQWHRLLSAVAAELKETGIVRHDVVLFGVGDCLPLMPFNKLGLRIKKMDWSESQGNAALPELPAAQPLGFFSCPESSVAIVGASCRLPGANDMEELWELLCRGDDRHEELKADRFDLNGSYRACQSGNFAKGRKFYGNFISGIEGFDNAFFGINPREATSMDPQQRLLLELSYEAMECSGYIKSHVRERGDAVGCFIGASFIEYLENTNAHAPTAYSSTGTIGAFLSGRISHYFGWTGPSEVIDTACSASLVAINRAVRAIRGGECLMALAGGINLMTGVNNFLNLARAGFLSPTGQCKPFDKDADGYCRADGVGLVALKPLKQAEADGDRIMGIIAGTATNQGSLSQGITVPDSVSQAKLYRSVLEQAELSPGDITYIEAHGTGTRVGDPSEIAGIRSIFGDPDRETELYIGSIKGNIGHCEAAAGVAGLLKVLCMLEHKNIPGQASHRVWNPEIPSLAPDRITLLTSKLFWSGPLRAALINSYGAAGSNSTLLCCEAPSPRPAFETGRRKAGLKHPIIISARSASSLRRYVKSLANYLSRTETRIEIAEVAYTLSQKRKTHEHYVAFETTGTPDLVKTLTNGQDITVFQRSVSPRSVVLVFSGQNKQVVGLSKTFYESFATFRTYIDNCDKILQELGYPPILPAIFETTDVSNIVVLQTGLVAVQYASALTWIDAGLKVDGLLGHSLGELTALAVCGRLSIQDCLKLVAARANLMRSNWGPDKGSMLAVFSSRDILESLVQDAASSNSRQRLDLACFNSRSSQVVSGGCDAVADLEKRLFSRIPPIKYARISTSHGFHSHLVDPILQDLSTVSSSLEWKEPTIPIEICTQDAPGLTTPYDASNHARKPVFFQEAVQRIEDRLGSCAWVEAGIDTPIVSMVKRAVLQPEGHTFHTTSTKGAASPEDAVSDTVCGMWRSSLDVAHWPFLNVSCELRSVWLPPYQFDSTPAWLDNIDRATECQRRLASAASPTATAAGAVSNISGKLKLIVRIPEERGSGNSKRFRIAIEGGRFGALLTGHKIRGSPLCPASLYLECVAMALDSIDVDVHGSCLDFKGLDIHAPLGTSVKDVEITLWSTDDRSGRWEYAATSRDRPPSLKTVLHATGTVVVKPSEPKLEAMARLVATRMEAVVVDANAERMRSRRAYKLFSRVATYTDFLQGISNIVMNGTEAVADVIIPSGQPFLEESTVVRSCDAVSLDNFMQALGLLMNTGDAIDQNEVMVCSGVRNSIIHASKRGGFMERPTWKVHASYTMTSPCQAIGDVVVFAEDGFVAAALTGCRFTKVGETRLDRLLSSTSRVSDRNQAKPPSDAITFPSSTSSGRRTPSLSLGDLGESGKASSTATTISKASGGILRRKLETYTGTEASSILSNVRLVDLGLDSLAATELAGELQYPDGVIINGQDLLSMTVAQAEQLVYGMSVSGSSVESGAATQGTEYSTQHTQAFYKIDKERSTEASSRLIALLVETAGMRLSSIEPHLTLEEFGVDSLALTEITSLLSDICPATTHLYRVSLQSTVGAILLAISEGGRPDDGGEGRAPSNEGTVKLPGAYSQAQPGPYSEAFSTEPRPLGEQRSLAMNPPKFETVEAVYKEIDGVKIEADIFMPPSSPSTRPMPVALMLHGGAHMALSRKTARPPQIAYLLDNNVLPVSLDYRLCPEINVVDGAMTDVRDAFGWARRTLPILVAGRGIVLDTKRIVVIGWSTGGHLAMSTAWTVEAIGEIPPVAILSFYSPVDFIAGDATPRRKAPSRTLRRMSRRQLMRLELARTPLTKYTVEDGEVSQLGPIRSGDLRSELVLSLFEETDEFALSLLLNGVPGTQLKIGELVSNPPTAERVAAICPTARVRAGEYQVPTFIVHGDSDEVASMDSALGLYEEMRRHGVHVEFLTVKRGYHGYDIPLRPGMAAWDEQVAPGYQFLFNKLKKA